MRFYDRIAKEVTYVKGRGRAMPVIGLEGMTRNEYHESLRSMDSAADLFTTIFDDAHVFSIQNVADLYRDGEKEQWDLTKDFPNLAPPYGACWFEYGWTRYFKNLDHVGILMAWQSIESITKEYEKDAVALAARWPGAKWLCLTFMVGADRNERAGLCGSMSFGVDEHGAIVVEHTDGEPGVTMHLPVPYKKEAEFQQFASMVRMTMGPAFLATSLLHCKNVKVIANAPPRKLAEHHRKRGRSLVTFHTLDIKPMRRILQREGDSDKTGLKHAVHFCRAHFKTYTPEAPLLGRHTGTWFWGDQVRGSSERGVSLKDYEIEKPADKESQTK